MIVEVLALCVLSAGDWPQFRGPQSDAHATHAATPVEWSDTKNVAWKVAVPGLGWSSPVVVGGRIFLTTAVPRDGGLSLRALALDAGTGQVIWEREVRSLEKAPPIHSKNSHASPTPLVSGGAVYVHFGALGTARLSADSGEIQWLCQELDYPPVHGSGGSPVLQDGKLIVVCDGSSQPFVAAIDAATGKVAWRTPRSVKARISHSFVTPAITVVDGQAQVLAPGPDHFAAYDVRTGAELWRVLAPGWSVVPQPTIGHGLVIYNHDYDHPELIAVKLGGKGDVTDSHIVWRMKRGAPSTPTPLLVGDELYFVSDEGIASCLDARTGERHWTQRMDGNYSASPVYVNGRVLLLNETGLATWVQPGKTFQKLGQNEVPGRTFATPAFVGQAMYLRTDTHLYKIGS
ncbi:MAG: PQQ-binding-like beta-propeller repeat protein [Pirellulales bacterium]